MDAFRRIFPRTSILPAQFYHILSAGLRSQRHLTSTRRTCGFLPSENNLKYIIWKAEHWHKTLPDIHIFLSYVWNVVFKYSKLMVFMSINLMWQTSYIVHYIVPYSYIDLWPFTSFQKDSGICMLPASWTRCHTHAAGVPSWSYGHLPSLERPSLLCCQKCSLLFHSWKSTYLLESFRIKNCFVKGDWKYIWKSISFDFSSQIFHLVHMGGLVRMPWPSSTRVAEWTHAVERPWHIMPEIRQKSHTHSIKLNMIYDALRM